MVLFKIASNGIFRILTNLTSQTAQAKLVDIDFKTLQFTGARASIGKEFKGVRVLSHDRSITRMQLVGKASERANEVEDSKITAKLIGSDGQASPKLTLEFSLSKQAGDATDKIEYVPFSEYYAGRIVVIRNKFDIIPKEQFKIFKGTGESETNATSSVIHDTFVLQLYLSGTEGDTQCLEVYYQDGDYLNSNTESNQGLGRYVSLFEQNVVLYSIPGSEEPKVTNKATVSGTGVGLTVVQAAGLSMELSLQGVHPPAEQVEAPDLSEVGPWSNVCFPNPYPQEANEAIRQGQAAATAQPGDAAKPEPNQTQDPMKTTTNKLYTIYQDFSYDISVMLMSNKSCLPEALKLTHDAESPNGTTTSSWAD